MSKNPEEFRGIVQKAADTTVTSSAPLHQDGVSMSWSEKEYSLLQNGMLNLELDLMCAIETADDVLLLPSSTEGLTEDLRDRLTCLKKRLNKSLLSVKDWRTAL